MPLVAVPCCMDAAADVVKVVELLYTYVMYMHTIHELYSHGTFHS